MLLVFAHCHEVEQQLLAFVVSFFDGATSSTVFGILKIALGSLGYHLGYQSARSSEILQGPKKR